jgi:hypothetical protein
VNNLIDQGTGFLFQEQNGLALFAGAVEIGEESLFSATIPFFTSENRREDPLDAGVSDAAGSDGRRLRRRGRGPAL